MSNFWEGKKVLVTGGGGFIGSHLCEELVQKNAKVFSGDLKEGFIKESKYRKKIKFLKINLFNLKECVKNIKNFDVVMHLAALVGGINYNMKYPADIFLGNVIMTSNVAQAIVKNKIKNVLFTSSACVYPSDVNVPTKEEDGFKGEPEKTNLGYGWAKRAAEITGKLLYKQYKINVAIVRPYNAYGPRDKFDMENAHVIAAIINKVFNTKDGKIEVWGTGEQTRTFLYVKDVVRGMMLTMEKYAIAEPVNLGSDEEIKIKDLVKMIIKISGRDVKIIFNTNFPDGYKRRKADTQLALEKLGFKAEWCLKDGLKETIDYYLKLMKKIAEHSTKLR